jgi:hypothetical protein
MHHSRRNISSGMLQTSTQARGTREFVTPFSDTFTSNRTGRFDFVERYRAGGSSKNGVCTGGKLHVIQAGKAPQVVLDREEVGIPLAGAVLLDAKNASVLPSKMWGLSM